MQASWGLVAEGLDFSGDVFVLEHAKSQTTTSIGNAYEARAIIFSIALLQDSIWTGAFAIEEEWDHAIRFASVSDQCSFCVPGLFEGAVRLVKLTNLRKIMGVFIATLTMCESLYPVWKYALPHLVPNRAFAAGRT